MSFASRAFKRARHRVSNIIHGAVKTEKKIVRAVAHSTPVTRAASRALVSITRAVPVVKAVERATKTHKSMIDQTHPKDNPLISEDIHKLANDIFLALKGHNDLYSAETVAALLYRIASWHKLKGSDGQYSPNNTSNKQLELDMIRAVKEGRKKDAHVIGWHAGLREQIKKREGRKARLFQTLEQWRATSGIHGEKIDTRLDNAYALSTGSGDTTRGNNIAKEIRLRLSGVGAFAAASVGITRFPKYNRLLGVSAVRSAQQGVAEAAVALPSEAAAIPAKAAKTIGDAAAAAAADAGGGILKVGMVGAVVLVAGYIIVTRAL